MQGFCSVTDAFRFGVARVKERVAFDVLATLRQKSVLFFLFITAKSGGTAEIFRPCDFCHGDFLFYKKFNQ